VISNLAFILLAIRNTSLADTTAAALSGAGYETDHIWDINDLSRYDSDRTPDAIVFDATAFHQFDIRNLLRLCKASEIATLAIVCPADLGEDNTTRQTDDFISDIVHPKELVERIERLLSKDNPEDLPKYSKIQNVRIDRDRFEVTVDSRRIFLTYMEYQLINVLASIPRKVFTRKELLSSVWGYAYFGGMRTVDVHIRRLRSKLNDIDHTIIETVWNVGYRFIN
jgi:DNA-binding response OmpR family regulator